MTFCIDIGNSLIKTGLFVKDELIEVNSFTGDTLEAGLNNILNTHTIRLAIVSDVAGGYEQATAQLAARAQLHQLAPNSRLPFTLNYASTHTLGADRIAAIAGLPAEMENENCLIVCFGSCITYNIYSAGAAFLGGAISPGINMRLKALHTFTGKLPLVLASDNYMLQTGKSTDENILSGTVVAAAAEVNKMIEQYIAEHGQLKVVATGGEWPLFAARLNYEIFADPHLILRGLNKILALNAD